MAAPGGEESQQCHEVTPQGPAWHPGARAGMEVEWRLRQVQEACRAGLSHQQEPSVQGREVWGVGLWVVSGCAHV